MKKNIFGEIMATSTDIQEVQNQIRENFSAHLQSINQSDFFQRFRDEFFENRNFKNLDFDDVISNLKEALPEKLNDYMESHSLDLEDIGIHIDESSLQAFQEAKNSVPVSKPSVKNRVSLTNKYKL